MANNSGYIQVSTTVTKRGDAERVAVILMEKRLAACIQIVGPVMSVYRWKGKIRKSKEWLCIVKSKKGHYRKIEEAIKKVHPYELPEIIATPIIKGSREYLEWIQKEI